MEFSGISAFELVDGLRTGRWTSVDLTQYFLGRVLRQKSNAVAWTDAKGALGRAREIDEKRTQGKPVGSLQGLPFTVKDAFRKIGRAHV